MLQISAARSRTITKHTSTHHKALKPAQNNVYEIKGIKYKMRLLNKPYKETGIASWYKGRSMSEFGGRKLLTAAHRKLPMLSLVKVTNTKNGKTVIVMINDKGPFIGGRVIDLCKEAAEILNMKRSGLAKVRIEYLAQETAGMLQELRSSNKHKAHSIAYQYISDSISRENKGTKAL